VGRCPAAHTCMTVYAWPHNLDSYVARTRKSIPRSPALSGPISLSPLPRPSDRPRLVNRCLMRRAGAGRRVTAGHHRPREAGTAARRRLASPAGLPPDKGEAFADARRGPSPHNSLSGRRLGGQCLAGFSRLGYRLPALPRGRSGGFGKGRRPVRCLAIGRPLACPP